MHMPSSRRATVLAVILVASRLEAQDTTATPRAASNEPAPQAPAVQIDGLLQVWYLDGHTITSAHDSYRIRRADVKLSGIISPRVRWRISLDGAKNIEIVVDGQDHWLLHIAIYRWRIVFD